MPLTRHESDMGVLDPTLPPPAVRPSPRPLGTTEGCAYPACTGLADWAVRPVYWPGGVATADPRPAEGPGREHSTFVCVTHIGWACAQRLQLDPLCPRGAVVWLVVRVAA